MQRRIATLTVVLATLTLPATAVASPSKQAANRAVQQAVQHRYRARTELGEVVAKCRPLTVHGQFQFSCRYGISRPMSIEEGVREGEEGCQSVRECRWAYSGLAQVYVHGTRLTVELLGPLYNGGEFAP